MSDTFRDLDALLRTGRKFGVIYADPPWTFDTYSDKGKSRSAENHYACMSITEIKRLPVCKLAAADCVLMLWGTNPRLKDVLAVIEAWGFTYKTVGFTWIKHNLKSEGLAWGTGYWTRANSELCLLATRGHPKRVNADVHSVIMAPRREHSRKPDEAYERIERLVGGPYVELFARRERPGWVSWGNEVPVTDFVPIAPTDDDRMIDEAFGCKRSGQVIADVVDDILAQRDAM
jgi:N6-adenosine-specific RNA methylase IME4